MRLDIVHKAVMFLLAGMLVPSVIHAGTYDQGDLADLARQCELVVLGERNLDDAGGWHKRGPHVGFGRPVRIRQMLDHYESQTDAAAAPADGARRLTLNNRLNPTGFVANIPTA